MRVLHFSSQKKPPVLQGSDDDILHLGLLSFWTSSSISVQKEINSFSETASVSIQAKSWGRAYTIRPTQRWGCAYCIGPIRLSNLHSMRIASSSRSNCILYFGNTRQCKSSIKQSWTMRMTRWNLWMVMGYNTCISQTQFCLH